MTKDNLDPKGQSRTFIEGLRESRYGKYLFNNKGFVGDGSGEGEGEGEGAGEGEGEGEGEGTGDGTGKPTVTPDWKSNLDESIRQHPALQNFKNPYDVAKSYVEAQKLIGRDKIPVPGKDANPLDEKGSKDWDVVYDRLGRPSNPADYALPEIKFPEGFPSPDEGTLTEFKGMAHKLGLLPHQVAALYKWDAERGIEVIGQHNQTIEQQNKDAETGLRKEYGVAYDANLNQARAIVNKFGGKDVIEMLDSTGMGSNPKFIKFMVNVAKNFGENSDGFGGEAQTDIMSPEEAKNEISKIRGDKEHPYHAHNRDNPEHKAAVARMSQLFQMAHPDKQ